MRIVGSNNPVEVPTRLRARSDEEIAQAVAQAELPPLLVALAQTTGRRELLDEEFAPTPSLTASGAVPQGGLSAAAQCRARDLIVRTLLDLRDGLVEPRTNLNRDELLEFIAFIAEGLNDDYLELARHELGLPDDPGRPAWSKYELAPSQPFNAVVIGAGMSGLLAAHRLRQAGIDVTVLEKNADLGGVWLENTYPGCRLDTPNFAYSYSFEQRTDWGYQFSRREDIFDYFKEVATTWGVTDLIRFETAVQRLVYDDHNCSWTVHAVTAEGQDVELRADVVVSAVGQLNQPRLPEIPGLETFGGACWHSARWDHSVDLHGKRVAVIGTGASAYQLIPDIATDVDSLAVFQRTPPWMMPTPTYHDPIPEGMTWLLDVVPYYGRWLRFWQFWQSVEGRRAFIEVDPDFDHEVSVSELNEQFRQALVAHLESQFSDRPDLLSKVVPSYPPGAKRLLRDNGDWARTLKMPHVELVSDEIEHIDQHGIVTVDGAHRDVDVIILATGFRASDFLSTMTVEGREGRDLHREWGGDARAYLGLSIPGFPNLFCLYGPNTNLVVNGSLILFSEAGVNYILDAIRLLLTRGGGSLEVRQQVTTAYNRRVDEANARMAWGASDVSSWYKNASGRVSQNWPFSILEYWRATRSVALSDYVHHRPTPERERSTS